MKKKSVSFVGNCQSNALANFYRKFVGNASNEEVAYVDDLGLDMAAVRQAVDGSAIVIVQRRDFNVGLTADDLGSGKEIHTIPLIMAGFLWPFANEAHPLNVAERPISDGPYPSQMGDSFLNKLIRKGVSPEEALAQYSTLNIAQTAKLDRMLEIYVDRQRQRDVATGFDLADFIADNFRDKKLFLTAEHPNTDVFARMASQLFDQMGVASSVRNAAIATLFRSPFPPTELPLHPGVIAHFGLQYADSQTRYAFHDEGSFTFEDYVLRYMCYQSNAPLRSAIYMADRNPPEVALADLDSALAASPASQRGFYFKGMLLRRLRRLDEACEAFRTAIDNAPEIPENYVEFVRTLLQHGELNEAYRWATRAITQAPTFSEAHVALAEVLIEQKDLENALRCADVAARLDPTNANVFRMLGMAFAARGELQEAETCAVRATRIEPSNPNHANLLAEIFELQSRRPEAVDLLETLLSNDRGNDQTYSLLGNFRLRDDDLELAEQVFAAGVEIYGGVRPDLLDCLQQVQRMRIDAHRPVD